MSSALLRLRVFNGISSLSKRQNLKNYSTLKQKWIPLASNKQPYRNYASSPTAESTDKTKKISQEDEKDILLKLKESFEIDEQNGEVIPTFKKALLYGHKIAIKDAVGEHSYLKLYLGAKKLASQISNYCGTASNSSVAFLCPNDALYPLVQWACWFSGQVAVPLSGRHPKELLKYFINDSETKMIITSSEYEDILKPIADSLEKMLIVIDHSYIPDIENDISYLDPKMENILQLKSQIHLEGALNNDFYTKSNAMILYTSGTTGKPKGVVLTHKNLTAQVNSLINAWKFNEKDCVLHVLPLNHIHGCVNGLMCPLNVGSKIIMHEKYDSHNVWSALLSINTPTKDRVNLFMAVPTIYSFLIEEYDKIFAKNSKMVEYIENHCKKNIRLMVSGSAPLPITVFNRWYDISGHKLLERYGMTEVGMALSNPYFEDKAEGSRIRRPGTVGLPLPDVEVRLVDSDKSVLLTEKGEKNKGYWQPENQPLIKGKIETNEKPIIGELEIKGPTVFKEYFNRPEETKKEMVDGYFRTGDIACYENGVFKMMGRSNVDIIKTAGYRVSALEIETHLLNHPNIKDVTVVGVDDDKFGQKIAAVCVLRDNNEELGLENMRAFCSERLPSYQMPTILKIIHEIPRNNMGKVNKKDVLKQLFCQETEQKTE
ncbi:malonate--CoA ligase ACSF3, mitochondrial [Condylostylus longicornis]|uniref:malonate--CoA ligase ACSF3, mitochondrial n=1 Tax=Condylostylus longicornis TaxID=2530218 RepID=UPI00244DEE3D|nr:malonate--CoA ligase ACSF3, mitochondrial [Condylostylus longicornis]